MLARIALWVLIGIFFLAFPLIVPSDYYQHLLIIVLMWVVIGSSWNLLAGYTGQISFGHAIFFGVGAYTAGILFTKFGISSWWGMAIGGLVAMGIALFVGWVCFRLRGPYFALATLAGGEIFRLIATNWESLTEGMVGILIIQTFRSKLPYYYVALSLAAVCVGCITLVTRSKWGYYFVSIREDQDTAEAMGINTTLYKNISLLISSFFTGSAGAFYMNYMGFIDPEVVFHLNYISIMAILVAIVGGAATLWGRPWALSSWCWCRKHSAARFSASPKWISQGHALVFGLLVIFVIMFLSNGIVGTGVKSRLYFSRTA